MYNKWGLKENKDTMSTDADTAAAVGNVDTSKSFYLSKITGKVVKENEVEEKSVMKVHLLSTC